MSTENIDEEQMVAAIRSGDGEAFEQLFFDYYDALCQFACRYVHTMFIAEGLVQDVLATIWEKRATLPANLNLRTYLFQSVKNKALDYLKHEKVIKKHEQEVVVRLYQDVYETDTESITKEGFIEAVQEAIEDLPEQSRRIYKLSRTKGLTYPEIAKILDVSPKTVEYHISKSLSRLRVRLAKYLPVLFLLYSVSQWV